MIISYVGNRLNLASDGKSFNTENHITQSLEKLGNTVRFIQENELTPGTLVDKVKGSDLFLFTRTWPGIVSGEDLREIEALGVPTVSLHLDKYSQIDRSKDPGLGLRSAFWSTQWVFSPENSVQAQREFKAHGINQRYLPAGVYADECYAAEPVEEFKQDIVFVGGGGRNPDGTLLYHPLDWPYRMDLIDWLRETYGDRFTKYGYPEKTVRGAELNQIYASSKLVIGDSLCKDFMDSYYWSDRCYEVTGRFGCLITAYIPGITDHFVDRKEIILYGYKNFVQLKNLIDYYLDDQNAEEREAIRIAGHERTKLCHTYTVRMQTMLDVLRAEGAIK